MPSRYVHATGKVNLEGFADILTVVEAAQATGVSSDLIKKAIREKKLKASLPAGVTDHRRSGRGLGYRIAKADLAAWFLGEELP